MTCNFTSGQRGGREKGDANYVEDVIYCSPLIVIVTSTPQLVLCPTAYCSRHHISHCNSSDCIIALPWNILLFIVCYINCQYLSVCNDKWQHHVIQNVKWEHILKKIFDSIQTMANIYCCFFIYETTLRILLTIWRLTTTIGVYGTANL
jgi:hypothetical protein